MMVKCYDVLGCVPADSGCVYCPDCCPNPAHCEDDHGAVFADSEWDSYPSCDDCGESIDGVILLTTDR